MRRILLCLVLSGTLAGGSAFAELGYNHSNWVDSAQFDCVPQYVKKKNNDGVALGALLGGITGAVIGNNIDHRPRRKAHHGYGYNYGYDRGRFGNSIYIGSKSSRHRHYRGYGYNHRHGYQHGRGYRRHNDSNAGNVVGGAILGAVIGGAIGSAADTGRYQRVDNCNNVRRPTTRPVASLPQYGSNYGNHRVRPEVYHAPITASPGCEIIAHVEQGPNGLISYPVEVC